MADTQPPRNWVVWSIEHGAWWGPDRCGYYTSLVGGAGLYTEAEAKQIEREANHGVKFGGPVNERAEPLSQHADLIAHYRSRVQMLEAALKES